MTCWLCGFETTKLATNANAPTCKDGPCKICIAVTNVDEEINQAVATLRRLLSKRCDLRSEQNRIHGTLIHRLPTEIKSYIFELLVPERNEWGELSSSIPRHENPVTPYTSVCRNWRDIAWSNPFLWSKIHIAFGRKVLSSDPSSQINFVQDWILRSRTLPLALHIVNRDERYPEVESKAVIDAINQCSNRWHSLSFDVSLELLRAFHHSNIQCHLLKNLRINGLQLDTNYQPVPLSNPTMSPESINICGAPFRSLQISWNHLTSAKVKFFNLRDLIQLFQHAPQLTYCSILNPYNDGQIFPPVVHHRLKTLRFRYARGGEEFLGCLTLPCLQEFHADELIYQKHLPALVHRSTCPLARITFCLVVGRKGDWSHFDHLQPLPGMTHLVIENIGEREQTLMMKKFLLEGYFPDLRHLTFHLEAFHFLWDEGIITLLLDRKRPHLDAGTSGKHCKILVLGRYRRQTGLFNIMEWDSDVGENLKALQLDISLSEDGFEILIPEGWIS